jgi:pimeloyl-ACP methyl ester carboxylesterase
LSPDVQPQLTTPYLKNVTVEKIIGAGHLLPWETPAQLVAFIRKKITG